MHRPLRKLFGDEEVARNFFETNRWPDGPVCPHCGAPDAYVLRPRPGSMKPVRQGVFKCAECRKQFSVRIGTLLEESKIPLRKWLMASYLICISGDRISYHQFARELEISVKSAWLLAGRIRAAMHSDAFLQVLVDELQVLAREQVSSSAPKRTLKERKSRVAATA